MVEWITLENETLRLDFDPRTGALVSLAATQAGWPILDRPRLGLSFRLLVPLSEERRNNPVYGEKQTLSALEVAADGRSARFSWDGVDSEIGGRLAVRLVLDVTLDERQAVFHLTVENGSPFVVENVYCPYLGDVQRPPNSAWLKSFYYNYGSAAEQPLWPSYRNLRGYYGVDYPTQFDPGTVASGAPMTPFILLLGEGRGLYAGISAPSPELVAWHTELRPGYGSSIDARVPAEREIAGKDVATRFAAVHLPTIQPGDTRALTPVALEAFEGGWENGADIYKRWRSTWMRLPEVPAWAREPHAWQQIHINSPEDELRLPFSELVKIGEDCARHGVQAIQLVGWNDGGQDQGNPSHDPDPRLGGFEALKEGIRQVQALGVKVILFSKFTWADRATQRFRSDLVRLAIKDPYGDYYHYGGYQYQTATQLLDINTKRLVPMCFLSEEYLRVCAEEFQKILDLGADGILFDECQHHSPALLCFDESHGHRPGAPVYANDRLLIQNFARQAARTGFLFAGEACYDWEMEAYHLAYFRSENKRHVPLSRYLLPEALYMTAVTGFDDRNMINQCLPYRYVISYEPYNFKGRLDDFPATVAYGKQMDALRRDLRDFFWDGEFRGTSGATVMNGDRPHQPYSVFARRADGRLGLVIANYEDTPLTIQAFLEKGQPLTRYRLVDDPAWKDAGEGILLPPQSAVVVV